MSKMLKGTEKALRASIKHWIDDGPKGVDMDEDNCPLCYRFNGAVNCVRWGKEGGEIERCPVYLKTDCLGCAKSPFNSRPNARQVKAEIKFLKSLLPEKTA